MKKIDFRKIEVKDIEGNVVNADISRNLGNLLYMQGQNIEECELGRDIYKNGEVDLDEKGVESVKRFVQNFPYLMRTAVLAQLSAATQLNDK